jgi:Uma2 family endonuclease
MDVGFLTHNTCVRVAGSIVELAEESSAMLSPTTLEQTTKPIVYPERDGEQMADNTVQFRWIVTIQGGLDALFRDNPHVFVAGDLLWYPVEGDPTTRRAPDVLVVFGRPKQDRGSYKQWLEDDIPPHVVFEVLSPGNTIAEMFNKFEFYDQYGVEEYYLYNPSNNDLSGWQRKGGRLRVIDTIGKWVSPRLGIRFDLAGEELHIVRPDGRRFVPYAELDKQLEQEQQRVQRLATKLRELGVDPSTLDISSL